MGESSNKMHHPQYSHIHWSFRAFRVFRSFPTAECRLNHLQVCRLSKIKAFAATSDLNRLFLRGPLAPTLADSSQF